MLKLKNHRNRGVEVADQLIWTCILGTVLMVCWFRNSLLHIAVSGSNGEHTLSTDPQTEPQVGSYNILYSSCLCQCEFSFSWSFSQDTVLRVSSEHWGPHLMTAIMIRSAPSSLSIICIHKDCMCVCRLLNDFPGKPTFRYLCLSSTNLY